MPTSTEADPWGRGGGVVNWVASHPPLMFDQKKKKNKIKMLT